MKPLMYVIFIIPMVCWSQLPGNSESINKKTPAKYPVQSGIISYTVSGGATGTATLYFDRNGWRALEHRTIQINRYGTMSTEDRKELTDGDYIFKINLTSGSGEKAKDERWSGLMTYKSNAQAFEAIMVSRGGSKVGMDTLLGKPCNKWAFEKGPVSHLWVWQGIPLKVIKKLPGLSYEQTAVSFTENPQIEEVTFTLPEEVIWK
ncbi:hypothetical protein [Marinoscillum sp. 108]|uniref:hypothetical protein n=1 Tax=Marinoscillum sp. 108 TaxID=2653151 RepID=UPI0012F3D393|nr:hypothetical protein [Marinoscillum sp. 108]VXD10849.1 conserved hypothetical protein [Marinoscillum sp. 108]